MCNGGRASDCVCFVVGFCVRCELVLCGMVCVGHRRMRPPWRNRLARSAVNRKVGGSSPPGGDFPPLMLHNYNINTRFVTHQSIHSHCIPTTPTHNRLTLNPCGNIPRHNHLSIQRLYVACPTPHVNSSTLGSNLHSTPLCQTLSSHITHVLTHALNPC